VECLDEEWCALGSRSSIELVPSRVPMQASHLFGIFVRAWPNSFQVVSDTEVWYYLALAMFLSLSSNVQ